jgi:ornithine cyclodeaminase
LSSSPGTFNDLNTVDIICTATPSTESLFEHKHLKPGVHINAIGSFKPFMREIPNDTIAEAKVVVDSLTACKNEAGDLILASKETNWSFDDIVSEIGQIANGDTSGRINDNDITIFKSVGLGFQDLVIAELVLDRINS